MKTLGFFETSETLNDITSRIGVNPQHNSLFVLEFDIGQGRPIAGSNNPSRAHSTAKQESQTLRHDRQYVTTEIRRCCDVVCLRYLNVYVLGINTENNVECFWPQASFLTQTLFSPQIT